MNATEKAKVLNDNGYTYMGVDGIYHKWRKDMQLISAEQSFAKATKEAYKHWSREDNKELMEMLRESIEKANTDPDYDWREDRDSIEQMSVDFIPTQKQAEAISQPSEASAESMNALSLTQMAQELKDFGYNHFDDGNYSTWQDKNGKEVTTSSDYSIATIRAYKTMQKDKQDETSELRQRIAQLEKDNHELNLELQTEKIAKEALEQENGQYQAGMEATLNVVQEYQKVAINAADVAMFKHIANTLVRSMLELAKPEQAQENDVTLTSDKKPIAWFHDRPFYMKDRLLVYKGDEQYLMFLGKQVRFSPVARWILFTSFGKYEATIAEIAAFHDAYLKYVSLYGEPQYDNEWGKLPHILEVQS